MSDAAATGALKMQDVKMMDQVARHEIAGHENACMKMQDMIVKTYLVPQAKFIQALCTNSEVVPSFCT